MPKPLRRPIAAPPDPRSPYRIEAAAGGQAAEIWIYDDIGWLGTTAKAFARELRAVDAEQITLHLNSPGGDAWDGIAIYNSLRDHKAAVTVIVDGMAASAASLIAMSGDTVRMNVGSQMMVHDAAGLVLGTADDMREFADSLDKTNDSMAAVYASRTGGAAEDWRTVMRAETWYTAAEAVEAGLADELVTGAPAAQAKAEWDLAARFRYPGREQAPAPNLHPDRPPTPAEAAARIHAASTRKPPAADPAPGPSDTTEGAAEMQFTDEERTTLRARFSLPADADDVAIKAALMAPPAAPPANPPDTDAPAALPVAQTSGALPPGMQLVSDSAYQADQERMKRLEAHVAKQQRDERDQVIAQAVKDGKFTPAQRDHFAKLWDADPEGTRNLINSLTKNTALATSELGYAGVDGDEEDAELAKFDNLFPPHMRQAKAGVGRG